MVCPRCHHKIHVEWESHRSRQEDESPELTEVESGLCPNCHAVPVRMRFVWPGGGREGEDLQVGENLVWPLSSPRPLPAEVDPSFASDFSEACKVLPVSPKASAALSR